MSRRIIVGSRGSKLALIQAESVAAKIKEVNPGIGVDITKIVTKGDRNQQVQLNNREAVGVFVKELEVCASLAYHRAEEYEGARQSTFQIAFDLMQQGKVSLDWMVTNAFSLYDYGRAFEMLTHKGRYGVIKAAFVFDK